MKPLLSMSDSLLIMPRIAISFAYFKSVPITFPSKSKPVPVISYSILLGKMIFLAVCSFTVKVPVLSEAITVQLPKDSAAFNFLTITPFFAILLEAIVKAIVRAKGKPSGIAETARAITDKKISLYGTPFMISNVVVIIATIKTKILICFDNFSTLIVSGDFSSLALFILSAIFPISV